MEGIPQVEVRELGPGDLDEVLRVHRAAFPRFFLTRMGPSFLRAYYRLVLEEEGGLLLGALRRDCLLGFAAGFSHPERFYTRMRRSKARFFIPGILGLLRNPGLLIHFLWNMRTLKTRHGDTRSAGENEAELASIAVHPDQARQGIGEALATAFFAGMARLGAGGVTLTTDADGNDAVLAFYNRLGLSQREIFDAGGGRRKVRLSIDLED